MSEMAKSAGNSNGFYAGGYQSVYVLGQCEGDLSKRYPAESGFRKFSNSCMVSKEMSLPSSCSCRQQAPMDGKSNGELEEALECEPCGKVEKVAEIFEEKNCGQLKLPRVLEALSASGLRAIRYANEVEGIGQVALDNDPV